MYRLTFITKIFIILLIFAFPLYANEKLDIIAADHLEPVFYELTAEFKKIYKIEIDVKYQPSGLIYDALNNGSKCDIFVSASIKFPLMLLEKKIVKDYKVFGYDEICIISFNPEINSNNWIKSILESKAPFFTAAPFTSSLGDYTWEMFENVERKYSGFYKIAISNMKSKENFSSFLQALISSPNFLGFIYLSNAKNFNNNQYTYSLITLPKDLNINATYCICTMKYSTNPFSGKFMDFILSKDGQKIIKKYNIKPKQFDTIDSNP